MAQNILIDKEFQALIPPLSAEEKQQLEANIVADGCRDPLVVWRLPTFDVKAESGMVETLAYEDAEVTILDDGDGGGYEYRTWETEDDEISEHEWPHILIDGHNRYEICTRLGLPFDTVQKEFDSREDVIVWMVDNQRGRRNLNDFQRTELQLKKKSAIAAKAKANQQGGQGGVLLPQNSAKAIDTRAEIADAAGVSHDTVSKVERIQETAAPELIVALRESKVSINAAADVATLPKAEQVEIVARGTREILQAAKEIRAAKSEEKRNERLEKIIAISTGNAPLGTVAERYPVLYLDPPWRYEHAESVSREIENQYPTMSLDDIKAMPIGDIAFDDCIMFMWATSPKLAEAFEVLQAWGFSYRTCAVWDKQKIGMGYYFRQQHELLLVAVKGSPTTPAPADRPSSVFSYPRGNHSAKPHEVYEIIEAMYPTLPKLEMFCRTPREGWGVWGNQSKAA